MKYVTKYETKYEEKCHTTYEKECHEVGYGYHKDYKCTEKPKKNCEQVPVQVRTRTRKELHFFSVHAKRKNLL